MTVNIDKCRVLVVDDEPEMCKGVQKILRNFDVFVQDASSRVTYEVDTATSKNEFFEAFTSKNYDLILLDYKMPEVSGLELLEYIVAQKKNTLVIMITAYATFETAVESTKLGAYDFLAKPFTPDEIRNAVKKATNHFVLTRRAQEFEEQRKKLRFQFISVLSHELKAPLNAVEGYLDILDNRFNNISPEDFHMMVNRSKIRIEGMRKLIFDLLDLTRIESGEKKRKLENVDIKQMAQFSADLFAEDAAKRNISIELDIERAGEFCVDKSELEIIFNNLISNAIKYNRDNGRVKVKIKSYGNKLRIIVADTGIGISESDKSRLFKEFSRIKNEKTIHILGSGLGLSTINKIAKLYNGNIKVKSKPDVGTAFVVTLFA
ncbi:MAG: hypothetical protein A2Y25_09155 [Candidatus Melainabacteria bacterium GWF2_37_15]|nr:MAG: hypothetical protein A2Y25_09155 [Candidatus Melainabacteria bacterium GWF2_37_15]